MKARSHTGAANQLLLGASVLALAVLAPGCPEKKTREPEPGGSSARIASASGSGGTAGTASAGGSGHSATGGSGTSASASGKAGSGSGSAMAGSGSGSSAMAGNGSGSSTGSAPAAAGKSFASEIRTIYRLLTCPRGVALPDWARGRPVIAAHCKRVRGAIEKHRALYLARARPFLAKLRPNALPARVVYPFGGADLLSALTTYPGATEITTISLEHSGDPRPAVALRGAALDREVERAGKHIAGFLAYANSKSTTLMKYQRGPISGELALFVAALAVHGLEPSDLRYFTFSPAGALRYATEAQIAAQRGKRAKSRSSSWTRPSSAPIFANAELRFRPALAAAGAGAGSAKGSAPPPRAPGVHRHVAANLANGRFKPESPLSKHLRAKGRISAMTKAASYLLWRPGFSNIRRYLLDNAAWMLSDSTGVPPRFGRPAGFRYVTFGVYRGCFFKHFPAQHDAAFRAMWQKQPRRGLPFRYGYPDKNGGYHMLVMKRAK